MKSTVTKKRKNDSELLDQATNSLLRAVKDKLSKTRGGVNYDKLRQDGFSERFLAKLEKS